MSEETLARYKIRVKYRENEVEVIAHNPSITKKWFAELEKKYL